MIDSSYNSAEIGHRIREKRLSFGYTQSQVADRIDRSAKYYADIERGYCGMSLETMLALSRLFNLSLDYLILGIESKQNHIFLESPEYLNVLKSLQQLDGENMVSD